MDLILIEAGIIISVIVIIIIVRIFLNRKGDSDFNNRLINPVLRQANPQSDSEPDELTDFEQKDDFEKLKKDNRFSELIYHINASHRTTLDAPMDDDTYRVIYAVKMTFSGVVLKFNDPAARYLIAYLRNGRKMLQYTFDIKANTFKETKIPNIVFNAAVPAHFRN